MDKDSFSSGEVFDETEYSPWPNSEMQELADMAGKFEEVSTVSEGEGAEFEPDPDTREQLEEAEKKSTEELTREVERAKGYEIYGPELEERLKRDEEVARINTLEIEADSSRDGSLILVCAQHPLNPDGTPGRAFTARLDEAILRYNMMKKQGQRVGIRVPGAVHDGDSVSLADAGKRYLIEHGIPEEDISADGTEKNGTDEVVFAYEIFENEQYRQFHICCGENQVFRNKMACIELCEILPYVHTSTVLEEMPHRLGFEVGNPNGGLRFLRVDRGVAADNAAKARHTGNVFSNDGGSQQ